MRAPTVLLVLALLASNLAWWWSARAGDADSPIAAPLASEPALPPPPGVPEAERLARELAAARQRITELEAAAAARVPAGPAPGAAQAGADAERSERSAQRQRDAERARAVHDRSRAWVDAALQVLDPARRGAALDEVRAGLASEDPIVREAALRALAQLRDLDFDKAALRPAVVSALQSTDAGVRAGALWALGVVGRDPVVDGPMLVRLAADPDPRVRQLVAQALVTTAKRELDGPAADAVFALLTDRDAGVRRNTLPSLHGVAVDARTEQHLLAMLDDRQQRHEALHFAFSRMPRKSPRVVAALTALLGAGDPENADLVRQALATGVGPAQHAEVADAFVRLLESRGDTRTVDDAAQVLRSYGSARHVPALETLLARPGVTQSMRQQLEPLLPILRAR
jgi:hypothetical protein